MGTYGRGLRKNDCKVDGDRTSTARPPAHIHVIRVHKCVYTCTRVTHARTYMSTFTHSTHSNVRIIKRLSHSNDYGLYVLVRARAGVRLHADEYPYARVILSWMHLRIFLYV